MSNKYEYEIKVDGLKYVVRFASDAHLSFFTPYSNYDPFDKFGEKVESYNTLGLSNVSSLKVFREVEKVVINHIKSHKLNYLYFTCVPARSSLYVRLAKVLAESCDMIVSNVNNTEFYLSKKA